MLIGLRETNGKLDQHHPTLANKRAVSGTADVD
jgi:hypothetical protein